MIADDPNTGWKQHFPTYTFENRDIALEEYKTSAKSLEAEERVFLNASNFTLVSSAAIGSLLIGSSQKLIAFTSGIVPSSFVFIVLILIVLLFSLISLKYFADRQRAIVFAGRKVIILRRMLGLSYGHIQLILPSWRVEGADQPLALRLFPGWMTYVAYPFWIITLMSCSTLFFVVSYAIQSKAIYIGTSVPSIAIAIFISVWFILLSYTYRISLLDTHERFRLLFYSFLCQLVKLPIVNNFEYVIYRARLSACEHDRLKISFVNLTKFLVFIEDKDFYRHSGISYKALMRALLGLIRLRRRSGGSTIVQQLIRTLFINDLSKIVRRKFLELNLAPWLCRIMEKRELLAIYLSSVRFERGKFGVAEAMNHFWNQIVLNPSNAQAFFLIERVSNLRSKLLVNKIGETAMAAMKNGLLLKNEIPELYRIYSDAVRAKKIIAKESELCDLATALKYDMHSEKA